MAAGTFGCQPSVSNPLPNLIVQFESQHEVIGLARENGGIALLVGDGRGGMFVLTRVTESRGTASVHLAAFGGDTGRQVNSMVFGTAPPGATAIRISPEDVDVDVVDGLYVAGLHVRDLHPKDLHWTFLGPDGSAVLQGNDLLE